MKKFVMLIVIGLSFFTSCKSDDEVVLLSDQEKSDLLFSREEEKLARDVYIYSYNKYKQNIFTNIADSEDSHMSSVLNLLNKYNIPDPVANSSVGVFSDKELQSLYNQLIAKSNISLTSALEVGAIIEDLDIYDLNKLMSHTTKTDLLAVYSNLSCGSRNHMRSFVGQLGSYTPIYISQSEYDSIINSANEKCGK